VSSSDTDADESDDEPAPPPVTPEEFDRELRHARAMLDPKDPPDAFFIAVRDRGDLSSHQAIQVDEPSPEDVDLIFDLLAAHIHGVANSLRFGYSKVAAVGLQVAEGLDRYEV
jgi:hypothetical protein